MTNFGIYSLMSILSLFNIHCWTYVSYLFFELLQVIVFTMKLLHLYSMWISLNLQNFHFGFIFIQLWFHTFVSSENTAFSAVCEFHKIFRFGLRLYWLLTFIPHFCKFSKYCIYAVREFRLILWFGLWLYFLWTLISHL